MRATRVAFIGAGPAGATLGPLQARKEGFHLAFRIEESYGFGAAGASTFGFGAFFGS
jgi:hypothetical protein